MGWFSVSLVAFLLALPFGGLVTGAVRPANDDFADRIAVSGEDLILEVTMEGATLQKVIVDPVPGAFLGEGWWVLNSSFLWNYEDPEASLGSVWWSWTAPRDGTVVILPQEVDGRVVQGDEGLLLQIWRERDQPITDWPFLRSGSIRPIDYCDRGRYAIRHSYAGFTALAGETYLLQFLGGPTGRSHYRLIMSGGPLIVEQPVDRTLLPEESSFLHVVATGARLPATALTLPSLGYQWLRDGVPIPGQTFSSLLLPHAGTGTAGSYQAVVRDVEGVVTSAVARVSIVDHEISPTLGLRCGAVGTTSPCWDLRGEAGRYYALESSTNLVNWSLQAVQASSQVGLEAMVSTDYKGITEASHVLLRGAPFEFRVRTNSKALFLRARRMKPPDDLHSAVLWIISYAKEDVARDHGPGYEWNLAATAHSTDIYPLVSPEVWNRSSAQETECNSDVILGSIGSVPSWPCVPTREEDWKDPYWFSNPAPVWNPAR